MDVVNFLMFLIFALLCYSALRFSRLIYGDYLAPVGIFLGVNLASIAFHNLNLLPLIPISVQAYLLIAVAFFSFFLGALLATPSFALRGKLVPACPAPERFQDFRGLGLFYYLTATITIAGWLYYVTYIVPPGWTRNLWMLQGEYYFPYHMGYSLVAGSLVVPSFILLRKARRGITLPSLVLLVLVMIALALSGIKTYLIVGLTTGAIVWSSINPGRVKMRHLVVLAFLAMGFQALYERYIDIFVLRQFPGSRFPPALSFLEGPYLYLVGSWSAVSVIMENPPPQAHWGQVTLLLIWKILGPGGLGIMERVPKYLPFISIGWGYLTTNVYSLIGEVYWDFGWLGVICACFLLGFVSVKLYLAARKNNDWILHLLSGCFSYGLFISFFAFYYRDDLIFLLLYSLTMGSLARKLSGLFKRGLVYRTV
ncbi:MAG: O-antigen polymerase [Thermoproteota archaeon]